jgi:hypothetical protein
MLFTVEIRKKRGRWGAISCLCPRTVHVLLRQGDGQKGRKRLGQQPSHVTSDSARHTSFGVGSDGVLNCALASSKLCCKLSHCFPTLALCDDPLALCRTDIWPMASIPSYFLSKLARCRHSYNVLKLWC